jgi:hypothetical protein
MMSETSPEKWAGRISVEEMTSYAQAHPPLEEGVTVRLLSPLGVYPIQGFRHREGAMVLSPDVCCILTAFKKIELPEHYYSEIEFLSPFEVRLLASVILSHVPDSGSFCLYPTQFAMERPDRGVDLSESGGLDELLTEFRVFVQEERPYPDLHNPPLIGGRAYSFNEHADLRHEHQHEIFSAIDVSDHLMTRGLGSLIRAFMLFSFGEFNESAGMSLWVSMEASLEIVKGILRAHGIERPTAKDAGEFLDDAVDNQFASAGYFTDYYEDRIKTVHPASRYGVFPGAGLAHDDVWELGIDLVHLYDFLITGHVPDELKGR